MRKARWDSGPFLFLFKDLKSHDLKSRENQLF
jgi:hypothetical protein